MGDQTKKNVNLDNGIEDRDSPDGPARAAAEVVVENLPESGGSENGGNLSLLARTERLLTLRAERVRVAAARLTEAQNELVGLVDEVRGLALSAAILAEKIPSGPPVWKSDLPMAARGTILLASILRQIREISNTTATTVESQSATIRELVKTTAEAAKASLYLAGKVSALAEEAQAVLPPLSSKNLVEAELQCLTGELEKVLTEFHRPLSVTKAGIEPLTPQPAAIPRAVN